MTKPTTKESLDKDKIDRIKYKAHKDPVELYLEAHTAGHKEALEGVEELVGDMDKRLKKLRSSTEKLRKSGKPKNNKLYGRVVELEKWRDKLNHLTE